MAEVAWPGKLINARLSWTLGDLGELRFIGPDGRLVMIPVTTGESYAKSSDSGSSPVWHIETEADPETPGLVIAVVKPSIHYVGKWHSPNPARFRLIEGDVDAC